jgi:hypothetical protein
MLPSGSYESVRCTFSIQIVRFFLFGFWPLLAAGQNLLVSPSDLVFNVEAGDTGAIPQQIDVNSSGAPLKFIVSATSTKDWLTVIGTTPLPDGGWEATTPKSVSVFVDPKGLAAGTYRGTVTISSTAAKNSPQTVESFSTSVQRRD